LLDNFEVFSREDSDALCGLEALEARCLARRDARRPHRAVASPRMLAIAEQA